MIKKVKFGNIFNGKEKHIAFAINKEGISDSEYTKQIVKKGFTELEEQPYHCLGSTVSKTIEDKTYHGLVCYSLREGWDKSRQMLEQCLNNLNVQDDIAIVEIGSEVAQKSLGADPIVMKQEMQQSDKSFILYKKV